VRKYSSLWLWATGILFWYGFNRERINSPDGFSDLSSGPGGNLAAAFDLTMHFGFGFLIALLIRTVYRKLSDTASSQVDVPKTQKKVYGPKAKSPEKTSPSTNRFRETHWQNYSGTTLVGADFATRDLSHSKFDKALLGDANFKRAILMDAKFRGAYANGADFYEADLEGADFTGATLRDANFSEAILERVNFSEADLFGASFQGASWSDETKWPAHFEPPKGLMVHVSATEAPSGEPSNSEVSDSTSDSAAIPTPPSTSSEATSTSQDRNDPDLPAQLAQLAALHDAGSLSDEEFQAAKAKLLDL
jgi:hypothetical protein